MTIKLEIHDASSDETNENYYHSFESMKADFSRIESEVKADFSHIRLLSQCKVVLSDDNYGELRFLDVNGKRCREPLYLTFKEIKIR